MKKLAGFNYLHIVCILVAFCIAGYTYLVKSFMPQYVNKMRPEVEKMAQDYINGSVKIGGLSWNGGLTIEVNDVLVKDVNNKNIASLPKSVISLRPWLGLSNPARALTKIELVDSEIWLCADEKDKWNVSTLLKPSESEETPFYGLLQVQNSKVHVNTAYGKWDVAANASVNGGANPKFGFDGDLLFNEQKLQLSGLMTKKGIGRININTAKITFDKYNELIKHYTGIKNFSGNLLDTHILLENNGKGALVSGETKFIDLHGFINVPEEEEHEFTLSGNAKLKESILNLEKLDALIDQEQKLQLHLKADVRDLANIGGQGLLTSPKLAYQGYGIEKLYLPFTLSKELVQVDKASFDYGGGAINTTATIDLREKSLTADVAVHNVSHKMSNKDDDIIHANGDLAIVGRLDEDRNSYQLHIGADTCDLSWKNLKINKLAVDGDFDGKKVNVDHFSAQTGDGVLALKGSAELNKNGMLALEGSMSDFAIDPVLYHFGGIEGKGLLSMKFKVGGTVASPEFGTLMQVRDADVMNLKMEEMHGFIGMKNKVLSVKKLGATLTQGRHIFDGTVDLNSVDPIIKLDVESKDVRVEPLVALATKDFSLTGNLNNKMRVTGTVKHPRVQGELALTDGSIQQSIFKGINGKYLYDDGAVEIDDLVVGLLIADVRMSGKMTKDQKLNFELCAFGVDVSKSPYKDPKFDIDGLMNFDGHVWGTLQEPIFEGELFAEKLNINGESYTDINGEIKSNMKALNNFAISFKQPHKDAIGVKKNNEGGFVAKGNLNLVDKFMEGEIALNNCDINGLLRTNRMDYAVEGNVDGKVNICPDGKGSGIFFFLNSNNINSHGVAFNKFSAKGTYNHNLLSIDEVMLQENLKNNDRGIIKAFGTVNTDTKVVDINATAMGANPAIVNFALKDPLEVKGSLNFMGFVKGNLDNLNSVAQVEILNGSVEGVNFDRANADISLQEDHIVIKELQASKDVYSISAVGIIPMDATRARADRRNPDATMNIALNFDNTGLGILTASPMVDWATGEIVGKLAITGTLDEPKIDGNVNIDDGCVKLRGVGSVFEHLQLDVNCNGTKLELAKLNTSIGKNGSINVDGYYDLGVTEEEFYKLNVNIKDAILSYSNMFKGTVNGELSITPQYYRDYWTRYNNSNQYDIQTGIRPFIKGNVRLDDVLGNVWTIADSEVGSKVNVGLDMKVELGPKIHMQNPMFYDFWMKGGIGLSGGYYSQVTKDPDLDEKIIARHNKGSDGLNIDGKLSVDKGNITYLRTVFKLTDAELNWTERGEIMPHVKLDSWSRFGKYRMFIRMDGSLGDVKNEELLQLTSSPPLERNTIVRMLTLQRETADGGNDVTNDDLNNVMSAGLQMAVLGNVELWVKQTLGLDQFRVYTGKVSTGLSFDGTDTKKELTADEKNRYNVLVSKYLTDKFLVGYTTSFDNDEKAYYGQYDLGRHFNLTYSEKQKLDSKPDQWYGVEYRIDFK